MQQNRKQRRGLDAVVAAVVRVFSSLTWQRTLVWAAALFALFVGVLPVLMLPFIPSSVPGDAVGEAVRALRIDTISNRIIVPARWFGLLCLVVGMVFAALKYLHWYESFGGSPGRVTRLARVFDRWRD